MISGGRILRIGVSVLVVTLGVVGGAWACDAPPEALSWNGSAQRTAAKLRARSAVVVVTLGGALTSGSFPEELRKELVRRYPGPTIDVRARGLPEDRPADMLMRFERDVLSQGPDLVIWEPGAYNVSGSGSTGALRTVVRDGIMRLRFAGIDVILLEPGHESAFVAEPGHRVYLETLRELALERGVPIYRRFDTTRHWSGREVGEPRCVAGHIAAIIAGRAR